MIYLITMINYINIITKIKRIIVQTVDERAGYFDRLSNRYFDKLSNRYFNRLSNRNEACYKIEEEMRMASGPEK